MLSAINLSTDDATVDVAVATLKAGISIAGLAAGVPIPLGDSSFVEDPPVTCPTAKKAAAARGPNGEIVLETVRMIDVRKQVKVAQLELLLNPRVDAYQQRLDELKKELELLKLQVQIAQQQELLGGG